MSDFHRFHDEDLESGWCLLGSDGQERKVKLLIGETLLGRSAAGLTIGRHAALCELVLGDSTVSRRHLRIGRSGDGLFAEDTNSLNGTLLDGARLRPFEPVNLYEGAELTLGAVVLTLGRMSEPQGA